MKPEYILTFLEDAVVTQTLILLLLLGEDLEAVFKYQIRTLLSW